MNDIRKWMSLLFWVMLTGIYSYWAWISQLNDFGGDSAVYLLTAQHWSFFGDTNPAASKFALETNFPPLYPLLLALFSAGQAWLLAHQITALCGVAALFVLWRYLRCSEFSLVDSLVAIAIVALVPGYYFQALYIRSEFLFLFFVSVCLYSILRFEREAKIRFIVVASLAATAACLTRTIGLSMVVALAVYVLLHNLRRDWVVVLVLAVAPSFAWMQFGQPPGGGYVAAWSEQLGIIGSPSVGEVLQIQVTALFDGFQQNFTGLGSNNKAAIYVIAVACFVVWVVRLWQGRLDALFLGAYIAILLAWPFPGERVRFVFPVVPILVVQLLVTLHSLKFSQSKQYSTLVARVAMMVLAIAILPNLALTTERHFEQMPEELEGFRQSPEWYGAGSRDGRLTDIFLLQRLQAGFEELRPFVPLQDCVYSIKPSLVGLFAHRNSRRPPLPQSTLGLHLDPAAVECRYVHISPLKSPTFAEPYYPMGKWAEGMDIIHVTRLIESQPKSGVATILAKIR